MLRTLKSAMIFFAAAVVYSTAAPLTILYIDDGDGQGTVGRDASENTSGNGWSWDVATTTLTLKNFDGHYIGTKDGDSLKIALSGNNKITLPETGSNEYTGINCEKNCYLEIFPDNNAGRDSLWIGQLEAEGTNYVGLAAGPWGSVGIRIRDVGLKLEFAQSNRKSAYFTGFWTPAKIEGSASLTMDFSGCKDLARVYGTRYSLDISTSGDVALLLNENTSSVGVSQDFKATGSGNITISVPSGEAISSGARNFIIGENVKQFSFEGKVLLSTNGLNKVDIASNKVIEPSAAFFNDASRANTAILKTATGDVLTSGVFKTVANNPLTLFNGHGSMGTLTVDTYKTIYLGVLASGGTKPYTFSIDKAHPLPSGLNLYTYYGDFLMFSGTPKSVADAGVVQLCVQDATGKSKCTDIPYDGIVPAPKKLKINTTTYNIEKNNLGGTGWSYDVSKNVLYLNNFSGSAIYTDLEEFNIVLTGTNLVTMPSASYSMTYGIKCDRCVMNISSDGDDVRDSLWVGNKAISAHNHFYGIEAGGSYTDTKIEIHDVGVKIELGENENENYGYNATGSIAKTYVEGDASLSIDLTGWNKSSTGLNRLYTNTTSTVSIAVPENSVGIKYEYYATGTGKTIVSAPNGVALGSLTHFLVAPAAGDIEFEGYVALNNNPTSVDIAANKEWVFSPSARSGFVYNEGERTSIIANSFVLTRGDNNSFVTSGSLKTAATAIPLTFVNPGLNFGSLVVGEATSYYKNRLTLLHLVSGGTKPYKFYVDEDYPLPQGLTLGVYFSTSFSYVVISGTPTAVHSAGFSRVYVMDALGATAYIDIPYDEITVNNPILSLSLSPEYLNLNIGKSGTFTANLVTKIKDEDPSISELFWKSENTNVATVDQEGNVTAKGAGVIDISATTKDGSNIEKKAKVYVKYPVPSASVSEDKLYIKGLYPNSTYTINGDEYTTNASGWISVDLSWYNKDILIGYVPSEVLCKSDLQTLQMPAAPTYTVTFNSLGNYSGIYDQDAITFPQATASLNDLISAPEITEDKKFVGYNFDGWYKNSEFTQKWDFEKDRVEKNTTLYAKWVPVTYIIRYNANGGSGTMDDQVATYAKKEALSRNAFTRTNYGFMGWDADPAGETVVYKDDASIKNLANKQDQVVNLYAVWEPDVFTVNVVGDKDAFNYYTTDTPKMDQDFSFYLSVKEGYVLTNGSSLVVTVNGNSISASSVSGRRFTYKLSKLQGDLTINVSGLSKIYHITFMDQVRNVSVGDDYIAGNLLPEPESPSADGYNFGGWYYYNEENKRTLWNFSEDVVTSDKILYAQWNPITYTIAYELNGGSSSSTLTSSYNIATSSFSLGIPKKDGYDFAGWFEDSEFKGTKVEQIDKGSYGNKKFYAKWTPTIYTITYVLDEGEENNIDNPTSYTIESAKIELKKPTKTGYHLTAWYTDAAKRYEIKTIETGSIGNLTLYPQWEKNIYDVVFYDLLKKSAYKTVHVAYQEYADNVADLTAEGHKLLGWCLDTKCEKEWIPSKNPIVDNITVYANWELLSYDISFDLKGGVAADGSDAIAKLTFDYGTEVTAPADPSRDGYKFGGWDPALPSIMPADNINAKAKWNPIEYTVTYNCAGADDCASNIKKFTIETETTTLNDPSRTEYNFEGWFDEANVKVTEVAGGKIGSLELTARWTPIEYHVTYNYGDGVVNTSANENHSVYTIETEEYTLEKASKTGYKFLGWFDGNTSDAKEVKEIAGGTTGDITLYAKFEIEQYTLSFYDVLADKVVKSTTVAYNNTATEFAEPSAVGYNLEGWCTDPDDCENTKWDAESPITAPLTVYTYWTINQYSIKFDLNGGLSADGETSIADIKQDYNSAIAEEDVPADPKREHYTFAGWEPAIPKTIPAGDVTVKAKWAPVKYTIAVSVNDATMGSVAGGDMYDYNTEATLVATAFDGYKFSNWEDDAEAAASRKVTVTGEASYTANFVAASYEVALKLNGGSVAIDVDSYTYGEGATLPVPTKDGYSFAGWFDNEDCEGSSVSGIPADATGEKTFYAKWEKKAEVVENSSSSAVEQSSSSSVKESSSSSEKTASSSSTAENSSSSAKSSSSSVKSSSSSAKSSSSSAAKPASSSSKNDAKSSSSSATSSSSSASKPASSSSKKTESIFAATQVPMFSLSVAGRNVQIAGARVGSAYAVLDMQGRVMTSGFVDAANFSVAMSRAGSYMIRIGSQVQRVNVK